MLFCVILVISKNITESEVETFVLDFVFGALMERTVKHGHGTTGLDFLSSIRAAKKQKKIPKALDEPLHIDIGKVEVKPAPMTSPPTKRRRLSSHNAAKDKVRMP